MARNRVAAINATTGVVTNWNPNSNSTIFDITATSSAVYVGGEFTTIGGQNRNYVAALNKSTGAASSWNPGANDYVLSLAETGGIIYAGGYFSSIGGQTRNGIAAIDGASGVVTAWNPNANNTVLEIATSGSLIYVGGFFTSIGGQARNRIAALNNSTGTATSWNPNANGNVWRIVTAGSTVYAGGDFTSIGSQSRNHIAALSDSTGTATNWNPNVDGPVYGIAISGSAIYIGGSFSVVGSIYRPSAAALSSSTGTASSWYPELSGPPYDIAITSGAVFFGGSYSFVGWQSYPNLAVFPLLPAAPTNLDGSSPTPSQMLWSWRDNSSDETGFKLYVDQGYVSPTTLVATTQSNIQSRTLSGYTANNAYSLSVVATNDNGDSEYNETVTRSTLIQSVAAINFSNVTATSITATPAGAFSNLTVGNSGIRMANSTAGTTSAWLQSLTPYTSSGLAPNTSYSFRASARNRDGVQSAALDVTKRTLAATPLAPTLSTPTLTTVDIAITAGDTNPAGTQYALQHVESGLYVQSSGALAASAIFRQYSAWATTKVTGLSTGAAHGFVVRARNGGELIETANSPVATSHTLCAVPLAPVVLNPAGDSLGIAIATGDGNAASVAYALREVNTGLYVQASGALGGSPVFQPAATWGTVTVTGLAGETVYGFVARARNGALVETADSPLATGTTLDASAPDTIAINPATTGPTNTDSVDFTVVFDEEVSGFDDEADLIIAHSGTAHGGISISGGPWSYTITISGITGDGSFTVSANTASDVADLSGIPLASSVTSAAVWLDNTPPAATLNSLAGSFVNSGIPVSLTLSEDGTNFQSGDCLITNAAVSNFAGAGQEYTLTLTGLLDGTFGIAIPAGVFADPAGNVNLASNDLTRTFDTTPPRFSGIAASPPVASAGEEVLLTFEVSETLVAPAEVAVNGNPANDLAKAPQSYIYLVQQADPLGPAEVVLAGIDLAGNPGMASSTDTLSIVSPAIPLSMGDVAGPAALAMLIASASIRALRRKPR